MFSVKNKITCNLHFLGEKEDEDSPFCRPDWLCIYPHVSTHIFVFSLLSASLLTTTPSYAFPIFLCGPFRLLSINFFCSPPPEINYYLGRGKSKLWKLLITNTSAFVEFN